MSLNFESPILSDYHIEQAIKEGDLGIEPFNEANINPASYDLSLCNIKSLTNPNVKTLRKQTEEGIIQIYPHESVLCGTLEEVSIPKNLAAFITLKSTPQRHGLMGPVGWIDPGFKGTLTCLIQNTTGDVIDLRFAQRMWNLVFCKVASVQNGYGGKYQEKTDIQEAVDDVNIDLTNLESTL